MAKKKASRRGAARGEAIDIALTGELDDRETEVVEQLLEATPDDEVTIYFDSPGGSPYVGMALMNLLMLRNLNTTGIVIGECSSAAILPWAACRRRLLAPHCALLFHPMRWEPDQSITLREAAECARHYHQLEQAMDQLISRLLQVELAQVQAWCEAPRFVAAAELIEMGVAEAAPHLGPAH